MLILLVEDDLNLAELIIEFLGDEGIECDHSANFQSALELIEANRYDAFVLDVNLPYGNGFAICEAIRQAAIAAPILMLTARTELEDKLTGFNKGADDYLTKPFALPELAARLQALGRRHEHNDCLQIRDLHIYVDRAYAIRGKRKITPSPEEWKLLLYLARKSPAVVSRETLESHLWPHEQPSDNALKMAVYRLRKLIDIDADVPLVHTVRGQGIALREEHK